MKLKSLTLIGLASLLLIACTQKASVNQPAGSPTAQSKKSDNQVSTRPIAQSSADSTQQATVKSGTFVNGEHPTQGTVRIIAENGKNYLELNQDFKTSEMGPDLHVILHRSDNVIGSTQPPAYPIKEGDYLILERLQKFSGAQRYSIPGNINLADYQSAVIWCRKFNATFGAAKFSS